MEKKSAMDIFMEQQSLPAEEESEELSDEFSENNAMLQQAMGPESVSNLMPAMQKRAAAPRPKEKPKPINFSSIKTSEELQLEKESIRVRETGFWFWRRIVVPPNVYVIHTRIGRKKPVTIGLGLSFKYNTHKDAYQVVPASMQTIGVVANCISKEKQGINVLAYLQWQIDDISIAYRKLDFSDTRDPLAIVNAQLREQAEAAIKDKIATMSVEEVLTDKAPIIKELTTRLKAVTEEREKETERYEGLGIKIITVQIREAIVCSQSLWKDLQSPFRYEKTKTARLSYLQTQEELKFSELETRKRTETNEAETTVEIERIKEQKQTEAIGLKLHEEETRFTLQQATRQQKVQLGEKTAIAEVESRERVAARESQLMLEKELEIIRNQEKKAAAEAKIQQEVDRRQITLEAEKQIFTIIEETRINLTRLQHSMQQLAEQRVLTEQEGAFNRLVQEQQAALEQLSLQAKLERSKAEQACQLELAEKKQQLEIGFEQQHVQIERLRQEITNMMGDKELFGKLIKELPAIASSLPAADELKIIQTGDGNPGTGSLVGFITRIFSVAEMLGLKLPAAAGSPAAEAKEK